MNPTLISFIVSLIVGAFAYLSSGNIIVSIALFLLFISYGIMYARPIITKHLESICRTHECHNFINTFLLSLSIRGSLIDAYENGILNARREFQDEISSLETLAVRDRIDYLAKYFANDIYGMFLNVLSLYENQGGNVLTMGEFVIKETNRVEQLMITSKSLVIRKLFELIMLWMITLAIILFMRFGLSQFYSLMLNGIVTILMTVCLFVLLLISFHLSIVRFISATDFGGKSRATI